jgi:hypothetical protein
MLMGFSDDSKSQYQRIHELLLTYYPFQKDEENFETSAAFKRALVDKEDPTHQEKWKFYLESVKAKTRGVLRFSASEFGTIMMPALGGNFTLKREKAGKMVYKRRFKVYLSLIGKFYTMFGQDEVFIEATEQPESDADFVSFEPVLYPTPFDIYGPWFYLIRDTIAGAYPRYEFVPYHMLRYRLKDISTGYNGAEGAAQSLFQALFSTEDINPYRTRVDLLKHPFDYNEFA